MLNLEKSRGAIGTGARRALLTLGLAFLGALGLVGAAPAGAATVWNLDLHHHGTNFAPGGQGQYWFEVANVGSTDSSGTVTLTVDLPAGVTRNTVLPHADFVSPAGWSCPGSAGDSEVVCTTSSTIPRHKVNRSFYLVVDVDPGAEGTPAATATLEGGGAAASATAVEPTPISPTPAGFGIIAETFKPDFYAADGLTPQRQAGGHPELLVVPFDFNTVLGGSGDPLQPKEAENIHDLEVDLPPGFVGNPTAVGECTQAQFTLRACPATSQVGREDLQVYSFAVSAAFRYYGVTTGVYNLSHPRGVVADLGFVFAGNPIHIKASLDPENRYAVKTLVPNVNESLPAFNQKMTLWGVPAADSHDSEHCENFIFSGNTSAECPAALDEVPFLTMPAQCDEEVSLRLHDYDSWLNPGDYGPDITHTLPGKFENCDQPRFEPEMKLEPTSDHAGTPTGLNVSVHVPQNDNPNALATPPVRSTVVTLPEEMVVNPSFADGLEGCSEAEIGLGSNAPSRCSDNSRIGEVELETPLLPKKVVGSMYLAEQEDNPFGSLLALYLEMHDTEERGVRIKVPGKIDLDPGTGQIRTTFEDLPQLPFEDLTLKFRGGDRAPLVAPPTCGTHTMEATMSSYAQPDVAVDVSNEFEVTGGSDCVSSLGDRPFDPEFSGGSVSPVAGAFSAMLLRASRSDADQELSRVKGVAPTGLSASLVGVARCADADIARAMRRDRPGQGSDEQVDPSCPAASQVGTVEAGAGVGTSPIYVPGKIYLAGPYKGAPLSGVAIVPAVAGPVDLGVVVVRAPARVDPVTAQLRLETDELPQILNGVRVRVKDVRVRLDRPDFTINPTSCREKSLEGVLYSAEGKTKDLSSRFQVGECARLGFSPRIALRLRGGVGRGAHPALKAVVAPRSGDANFSRAVVTLPRSAFLDQAHIRTICTRVQFAAGAGNGASCPPGARYGFARAWTPLVGGAFEGPVFLRSSDNELPDLVVALRGPEALPIDVELSSRIDSARGGLRSTFSAIPDVPVSRFVLNMQGGKKGLVVNSRNLCFKPKRNRARANLKGQNERLARTRPRVVAITCAKRRKAKRATRSAKRAFHQRSAAGR